MNSLSEELQVLHQPLRQHNEKLANRLKEAELLLANGHAAQAREALLASLQTAERFSIEWSLTANPFWRRIFATERANLLWYLSVPNFVLERYAEAEQNLQDARKLIGDAPGSLTVNILQAQGEIYRRQEKFEFAADYFQSAAYMAVRPEVRQWEVASRCYVSLALCFLSKGDREKGLGAFGQASDLALSHGLYTEARRVQLASFGLRIMSDPTGWDIEKFDKERAKLKLDVKDAGFQADLCLIETHFWAAQGEAESAKDALDRALELAQTDAAARFRVLMAQADYHAFGLLPADRSGLFGWQPDFPRAINLAEQARLLAANFLALRAQVRDAAQRLIRIRLATRDPEQRRQADRELDELRKTPDGNLVHALLARLHADYADGDFKKTLQGAEEAERYPAPPDVRRIVLTAKMYALTGLKRFDEALDTNRQAIEVLRPLVEQKIYSASQGAPTYAWMLAWRDRVEALAMLCDSAAALSVRAGRLDAAFDFAEAGRCQLFRQQLTDRGADLADQLRSTKFGRS
jgi:hypothetical protein